jgi:hypothetical protein
MLDGYEAAFEKILIDSRYGCERATVPEACQQLCNRLNNPQDICYLGRSSTTVPERDPSRLEIIYTLSTT